MIFIEQYRCERLPVPSFGSEPLNGIRCLKASRGARGSIDCVVQDLIVLLINRLYESLSNLTRIPRVLFRLSGISGMVSATQMEDLEVNCINFWRRVFLILLALKSLRRFQSAYSFSIIFFSLMNFLRHQFRFVSIFVNLLLFLPHLKFSTF